MMPLDPHARILQSTQNGQMLCVSFFNPPFFFCPSFNTK